MAKSLLASQNAAFYHDFPTSRGLRNTRSKIKNAGVSPLLSRFYPDRDYSTPGALTEMEPPGADPHAGSGVGGAPERSGPISIVIRVLRSIDPVLAMDA